MKIIQCDRCKKQMPETCQAEDFSSVCVDVYGNRGKCFDLCRECVEYFGLPSRNPGKEIGNRLLEILQEIARGVERNQS